MITSRQQLQAAVEGDIEALITLLNEHEAALSRRIRPLLPSEFRGLIDEEDILQETYKEAVFNISAFRPECSFEAWLFQIARNNLYDAIRGLRADKRYPHSFDGEPVSFLLQEGSELGGALLDLIADSDSGPCVKAARHEEGGMLRDLIDSLPDPYRDLLCAHYFEGLGPEESSRKLGCSKGAFFMRRARALKLLESLIEFTSRSASG